MPRKALVPSLLLWFLPVSILSAQCLSDTAVEDTATGIVFRDGNQNGAFDPAESGIEGVSVSNGCQVVVTDSSGRYQLPVQPGQILFISQPTGYVVPVNEHQSPQFYYLHYPDGTPGLLNGTAIEWRFPVVEPTGPLPESVDFPLYQLSERETRFTAHAFADTQAATDLQEDMLREDLVNTLLGNPYGARFVITVGDVVNDNLALYDRHIEMMGLIGVPQWNLPGNHDINFESPNARLANETYRRYFGPDYYSFNYGRAHIVALNNVEYAGAGIERFENGSYRGYIPLDQLHWLEQDLAQVPPDYLIVIATHIPLITDAPEGNGVTGSDGLNTVNFDALLALLAPFDNVYGLAGHDTSNSWKMRIDHRHGWQGNPWIAHTLAEARGSGWNRGPRDLRGVADAMMQDGNPNGFYVLKFDQASLVPEFVPFPFGADGAQRMRITLDPPLSEPADGGINRGQLVAGTKLVVNLFDGGERDRVWLSLDGREPQAMQHTLRTDPFVERTYRALDGTAAEFGEPAVSSHIWEYPLPESLAPGLHYVVVESEDEFGQRWRGVMTFELTPQGGL